ncbi:uncharacterized protein SPAPADRAFT_66942 [Spathaspora passalidarum NRRL Y-27907]|uniref:Uncharacterized protein n=1 Tax=Spathaspora passalidarum (strain NRRL Y-27907 / 11-Y1) TaxID=619300 RepID=G3APZ2_SPAPN|nr:uncharacterized protein SPAPADRAFT_66942 [Spathaspora passalidarum NRRL Y-27907]EGW32313.1 hypothetical protein SPAPADRAFT_66942 [Spathaspora passalidarum NRRL Y-27907]
MALGSVIAQLQSAGKRKRLRKSAFQIVSHCRKFPKVSLSRKVNQCRNYHTISLIGKLTPEGSNLLDVLFMTSFPNRDLLNPEGSDGGIWVSITEPFARSPERRFAGVVSTWNNCRFKDKFNENAELFKACVADVYIFSSNSENEFCWNELKVFFKNTLVLFGQSRIDKYNCHDHRALLLVVHRSRYRNIYDIDAFESKVRDIWKEIYNTSDFDNYFVIQSHTISPTNYMKDIDTIKSCLMVNQFLRANQCEFKIPFAEWLQNASKCWEYLSTTPPPYESQEQTRKDVPLSRTEKSIAEFSFAILGFRSDGH